MNHTLQSRREFGGRDFIKSRPILLSRSSGRCAHIELFSSLVLAEGVRSTNIQGILLTGGTIWISHLD